MIELASRLARPSMKGLRRSNSMIDVAGGDQSCDVVHRRLRVKRWDSRRSPPLSGDGSRGFQILRQQPSDLRPDGVSSILAFVEAAHGDDATRIHSVVGDV